jgi:DNA polymerase III alpha subunit
MSLKEFKKGLLDYFSFVSDFISYAKREFLVPESSAAGSIVSYLP